jgi:hypothetical protein
MMMTTQGNVFVFLWDGIGVGEIQVWGYIAGILAIDSYDFTAIAAPYTTNAISADGTVVYLHSNTGFGDDEIELISWSKENFTLVEGTEITPLRDVPYQITTGPLPGMLTMIGQFNIIAYTSYTPQPPPMSSCACDQSRSQLWTIPSMDQSGKIYSNRSRLLCWNLIGPPGDACDGVCLTVGSCDDSNPNIASFTRLTPTSGNYTQSASYFKVHSANPSWWNPDVDDWCVQENIPGAYFQVWPCNDGGLAAGEDFFVGGNDPSQVFLENLVNYLMY